MVDATDLKSVGRKALRVRVPPCPGSLKKLRDENPQRVRARLNFDFAWESGPKPLLTSRVNKRGVTKNLANQNFKIFKN